MLFVLCIKHRGLNYTLRARTGAFSIGSLCPCGMSTLGALAISILPNFMDLWQDKVSPHGCCTARPGNLRKSPSVSSPSLISSSQKDSGRLSLPQGSHFWEWETRPHAGLLWNSNKLCPLNDLTDQLSITQPNLSGAKNNIKTLNSRHTSWDKCRQHPQAQ